MNRFSAIIVSLAAGLALVTTGCLTPTGGQAEAFRMPGGSVVPTMPGGRVPSMPGAGSIPKMPGPPLTGNPLEPGMTAPDMNDPAQIPSHPATIQQPMQTGQMVAQVGYFTPCNAGSCGVNGECGCGSHQECAKPHGYAEYTPAGWNAYGIDPQEFICDGGDQPPHATLSRNDTIAGLQPEDTVVHYTTDEGDIKFQASNRTCLYAPRFAAVRKINGAVSGGRAIGLKGVDRPVGPNRIELNQPGLVVTESTELAHADVARHADAMRERNRGVPLENIAQVETAADVMALLAGVTVLELGNLDDVESTMMQELSLAALTWSVDESVEVTIEDLKAPTLTRDQKVEAFTVYDFPDAGRLRIAKLADRSDAQPGEKVTFAIRVENVGDSAVNHVVVTDNLTTRLEYVEDSQTCSGGAEFETSTNDSQSLKLQWKLTDQLRVGESVTIRFECKLR